VKVLLFVGTNFRGFYKIDPWVLEFVASNVTVNRKIVFRWIFIFRGLSGPRNQRKLEPHD